jgi:uncharacterized protein (DUF1501 family)
MSDTTTTRRAFLRKLVLGSTDTSSANGTARTLVCVFLRGGADTLNMFVPYADDRYYALRPTIAIKRPMKGVADCAVKLNDFYALHPNLAQLLPIFQEGRLGIVQAVGSDNDSGSHFEAQDQMEHGESQNKKVNSGGWLGRHLQTRSHNGQTPLSAVAIGPAIQESLRGAPHVSAITSISQVQIKSPANDTASVSQALSKMYGAEVGVLSEPGRATLALLKRVESLRGQDYKPMGGAEYAANDFGSGMREIARLIKANVGLEVACIDLGGWDTHFFQGSTSGVQAEAIDQLARGLSAFDTDIAKERQAVTTIVMTEFGRRVYENSSLGTDHGRGFALAAIGDHVNGGTIHGAWPGLEDEPRDILGPAGLPISFDYRSVLAEVLSGVAGNHHLDAVFPHFDPKPVGLIKSGVVPVAYGRDDKCEGCHRS